MDYITQQLLGNVRGAATNVGEDIRAIWQEHEDSETLESRFVQDIDKVELSFRWWNMRSVEKARST
jgi:putative hydrolase of HD superfamily